MMRPFFAALAFASVLGSAAPGRAAQVIVADVTYTHSAETTTDSHYFVPPSAQTPADWTSPIDYTKGSVHVKLEVKTKPTSTPTHYQVCFDVKPEYGCTAQVNPPYTEPGVYEWTTPLSAFYYPTSTVDWSQGVRTISLILKDTQNRKPQGDPLYVPTDLRVEVALLSEGATYVPPPPVVDTPDAGHDAGVDANVPPPKVDSGVTPPTPIVDGAPPEPPARDSSVDPPVRPVPEAGEASVPPSEGGSSKPPVDPRDSGTSGTPPDAGGDASVGGPSVSAGGGGCDCTVGTGRSPGGAFVLAVSALLVAGLRRRRSS